MKLCTAANGNNVLAVINILKMENGSAEKCSHVAEICGLRLRVAPSLRKDPHRSTNARVLPGSFFYTDTRSADFT